MSTHNICFCGEIRKISILKSALSGAMCNSLYSDPILMECDSSENTSYIRLSPHK